uniref:WD_REPEATS_REGION domain-containing protein n=1 Tax=Syphacia muris TaxID=451379 RepID=A0A158R4I7_9BILA
MNSHTEHRGAPWNRAELVRSCLQALEGRCSARAKTAQEHEVAIRNFINELEKSLKNHLQKRLEQLNETDRLLISRLNRAFGEMRELQPTTSQCRLTYHLPSPTMPAHRQWLMNAEERKGLEKLISDVCAMANIAYTHADDDENSYDVCFSALPPSKWNVKQCVDFLLAEKPTSPVKTPDQQQVHNEQEENSGYKLSKSATATAIGTAARYRSSSAHDTSALQQLTNNHVTKSEVNVTPLSSRSASCEATRLNGRQSQTQLPLEPSVLVREMRPSSFRERSLRSESSSNVTNSEEEFKNFCSNYASSVCNSALSSYPPYPGDISFDSQDSRALPSDGTLSNIDGPSSSSTTTLEALSNDRRCTYFGEDFLTRPIDVITLPSKCKYPNAIAISDGCGGVYITTADGKIILHIPIQNSSASSLAVDTKSMHLLVSVMQAKGRSIHVFDLKDLSATKEVISCPKEPKIAISRTRWITVSPRGEIFLVSGDNHKSALWMYNRIRKGWKTLKESRRTRYQYLCIAEDQADFKAVVLLTCDAAQNRLLLFVVDHLGNLINEYDLTKTYRLQEHIINPASALVDEKGNLLMLDYATGRLWILLSGVRHIRRLKEIIFDIPIGGQQALGLAVKDDYVFVTCFEQKRLLCTQYLSNGNFIGTHSSPHRSPQNTRRALSLPRPSKSATTHFKLSATAIGTAARYRSSSAHDTSALQQLTNNHVTKSEVNVTPLSSRSASCEATRLNGRQSQTQLPLEPSVLKWRTVKESKKTCYRHLSTVEDQADFKAVVLLTCDAKKNRLLLFVVDDLGNLLKKYDLTRHYRLQNHITSGPAIVDEKGNLLMLDYATGRLWILLSGVRHIRRLKEIIFDIPIGGQQALGLAVKDDYVFVTCFEQKRLLCTQYLSNGNFIGTHSSPHRSPHDSRLELLLPSSLTNSLTQL